MTETTTSTAGITLAEMSQDLTGFDELAIEKHFGFSVYATLKTNPVMATRALVFAHQRTQGLDDKAAKDAAMGMTARDLGTYFAASDEEDEDEEAGNDSD